MSFIQVSVIIPIYNRQEYVAEAIQSVLSQNLKNLELILVNDGSSDGSEKICEDFVAQDARVRYYYQENAGVSVARNFGVSMAQGEHIYFLDSDDHIDPNFLQSAFQLAKEKTADIIVCGGYYANRFPNPTALPTCALFLRKAFLDQHPDVQFPIGIQPAEDGLYSHQLLALTQRVYLVTDVTYFYRQHAGQNTAQLAQVKERILQQIPEWLEVLKAFYDRRQLWDSRALHVARFIEHEPFEFRYLAMPFDEQQKQKLFELLQQFMEGSLKPHLNNADQRELTAAFRGFIRAKDATAFDQWYLKFQKQNKGRAKFFYLLSKLMPMRSLKKAIRKHIKKEYQ